MIEQELKNLIINFAESFQKENQEKYGETAEYIVELLKSSNYNFSDPDIFNCMFDFQLEQMLELVTAQLHDPVEKSIKDKHKPEFIFLNYSFLKSNIEKLIDKKMNDTSCIADKSRYILKIYLNYSLTGKILEDCFEEHFWIPKFGTNQQWIDFCDGLYYLYYGNNDKYLASYGELINSEVRRYSHIKYSLIATMIDGKQVVMDECYDSGFAQLPLSKEGFYNIPKRAFKEKKDYKNANSLGELLNRFYYKVPVEDILKIEVKEEQIII